MSVSLLYRKSIQRAVNQGKWEQAVEMLQTMDKRGVTDTKATNLVLASLTKIQKWDDALRILKSCPSPDETSFGTVMHGVEWSRALQLLGDMVAKNIEPNNYCYTTVISKCEKGDVLDKALVVFDYMKQRNCFPTTITYNALISCCEKANQWEMALDLFRSMAYPESKDTENASENVTKYETCIPDVITFSALISALAKACKWELTLEILRSMHNVYKIEPNIQTYNAVLHSLRESNQVDIGLSILHHMNVSPDTLPNLITFTTLLEIDQSNDIFADKIYEMILNRGFCGISNVRTENDGNATLIDLHDFSVLLALAAVRHAVRTITTPYLVFIVGQGHHSAHKKGFPSSAKLRPIVFQWLDDNGWNPKWVEKNHGRIVIDVPRKDGK